MNINSYMYKYNEKILKLKFVKKFNQLEIDYCT